LAEGGGFCRILGLGHRENWGVVARIRDNSDGIQLVLFLKQFRELAGEEAKPAESAVSNSEFRLNRTL
jgi:hypothetical protein